LITRRGSIIRQTSGVAHVLGGHRRGRHLARAQHAGRGNFWLSPIAHYLAPLTSPGFSRRARPGAVERAAVSLIGLLASRPRRDHAAGVGAVDLAGVAVPADVEHRLAALAAHLTKAVWVGDDEAHAERGANLTTARLRSLNSGARRRKIMARRGKKFTPAEKHQRQAQAHERDRLEAITGVTEQLTCLDGLTCQVVDDCRVRLQDLDYDLGTARLALEFWTGHPAATDAIGLLTALEAEHQRHGEAIKALAAQFEAFVANLGNHEHVHLRPSDPYRQRVIELLYPPVTPPR
jgi:hypothetical protein